MSIAARELYCRRASRIVKNALKKLKTPNAARCQQRLRTLPLLYNTLMRNRRLDMFPKSVCVRRFFNREQVARGFGDRVEVCQESAAKIASAKMRMIADHFSAAKKIR